MITSMIIFINIIIIQKIIIITSTIFYINVCYFSFLLYYMIVIVADQAKGTVAQPASEVARRRGAKSLTLSSLVGFRS